MRTVILASDDSEMIKNYPYVAWAWNELEWNTHLFYLGKDSVLLNEYKKVIKHFDVTKNTIHRLPQMEGFENDVILGVAKLFGGYCFWDDRILMTADIDIIPVREPYICEPDMWVANTTISRYLAVDSKQWRFNMETDSKLTMDEEFKLLLDSNPDFKDTEKVNRTIAVNKVIIEKMIPKGMELTFSFTDAHIKLDPTCETNNLMNIENILRTNFNKVPAWM